MAAVTETVDGWFRRRGLTPLLSGTPLATSTSEGATRTKDAGGSTLPRAACTVSHGYDPGRP